MIDHENKNEESEKLNNFPGIVENPPPCMEKLESGVLYKLTPELLTHMLSRKDYQIIKLRDDEENFLS